MVYHVEYCNDGCTWRRLSATYDTFETAAMIALALENRGYETRIV